jgi:hypothetical protein
MKYQTPIFYDGSDETTPGTPAAAAAPPEAPAPAAPAPPPADAPWSADLRAYLGDNDEALAAADRYMREKVQPRITQLEQTDAPAQRLYKDLTDPAKVDLTVAAVVQQVYGEDVAEKFVALFGDGEELTPEATAAAVQTAQEAQPEVDPEDQARQEWIDEQRAREQREADDREYNEQLDQIIAEPEFKLQERDRDLLAPFMASSDTVGEVVAKYHAYVATFQQAHGITPAEANEGQPPAPPTLGSEGAPAATPPVAAKYEKWEDLDAAVVDYQREQRAKAGQPAPATL